MIEIAPETASMLYVGALLVGLFSLWAYDGWLRNKKELSSYQPERKITCEFCGHTFRKENILPIIQCPLCKCLHKQ